MDCLRMVFEMGYTRRHKVDLSHATYAATASPGIKRGKLLPMNILHMIP